MISARRHGPLTLKTADLDGMIAYYSEIIGLTVTSHAAGRAVFATQVGQEAIILEAGPAPGFGSLSLQISPKMGLDAAEAFLRANGVASARRGAFTPCIDEVLTLTDAAGNTVNLFTESKFLDH